MNKVAGQSQFRRKWENAFKKVRSSAKSRLRPTDFWEGREAYNELKRKDLLWVVFPGKGSDEGSFIRIEQSLSKEIRIYKRFAEQVVEYNLDFKNAIDVLEKVERRFLDEQKRSATTEVKRLMNECASFIKGKRASVEERRKIYWGKVLVALPEEMQKWSIDLDTLEQIPPEEVVQWEKVFSQASYPEKLDRKPDLDTRFERRVGVIFRSFLSKDLGVSLQTISRLVVLTYLCSGLAAEHQNDSVKIVQTGRALTVYGVYQSLRKAGLR